MTREEFAQKIRWEKVIFFFGLLNAIAVIPQLFQLWKTRVTEGLSVEMLFVFLAVQIAFTLHGFFIRDKALLYCIGLSALINTVTIGSALYLRSLGL